MKLFPFASDLIIALSDDDSRAVIRLRNVPMHLTTTDYYCSSTNPKKAADPAHRDHKSLLEGLVTFMFHPDRKTDERKGPDSGDRYDERQYIVAVKTDELRALCPEWFHRKGDDVLAVFERMQRDEVLPVLERLTAAELVDAKAMWSARLSGRLEETKTERTRAARVAADAKLGISTAGSHVLD